MHAHMRTCTHCKLAHIRTHIAQTCLVCLCNRLLCTQARKAAREAGYCEGDCSAQELAAWAEAHKAHTRTCTHAHVCHVYLREVLQTDTALPATLGVAARSLALVQPEAAETDTMAAAEHMALVLGKVSAVLLAEACIAAKKPHLIGVTHMRTRSRAHTHARTR